MESSLEYIMSGKPSYEELQHIYSRWFSLSGIEGDIDNKFALISLICTLTNAQKKPDVTCYEVIKKVTSINKNTLSDDFLFGLAIVCEDFRKSSTKFNNCGLKTAKEMVAKINEILEHWLPF